MQTDKVIYRLSALSAAFVYVAEKEVERLTKFLVRNVPHELRWQKHGKDAHGLSKSASDILRECRYQTDDNQTVNDELR